METCYRCSQDITGKVREHVCPVKLTPLEEACLGIMMAVRFCDHFCCGLPEQTCHAKTLAAELGKFHVIKLIERDSVEEIKEKLSKVPEGNGVKIEGLPYHGAFRFTSGPRKGDWIDRSMESGSWPLDEYNLKLAELDALHASTRYHL
jgi:hypothetical protein